MKILVFCLMVVSLWCSILPVQSTQEVALTGNQDVSPIRIKRNIELEDPSRTAFEIAFKVADIIISAIPNPVIQVVLSVARLVLEVIFNALWPSPNVFEQIEKLIITHVRKEIDATASKRATKKIIDYSDQIDKITSRLYTDIGSKNAYHNHVSKILQGQNNSEENYQSLLRLTESYQHSDSLNELPDYVKQEISALRITVQNARADFEHIYHPSSTAIQYSRFAMIDVMLKIISTKIFNVNSYLAEARESAKKHTDYLWVCIHWLAAEMEYDDVTTMTDEDLKSLGNQPWNVNSEYNKTVTKLSGAKFLGVDALVSISQIPMEMRKDDQIHHKDTIALRSNVVAKNYMSLTYPPRPICFSTCPSFCEVRLEPCNGGEFTPFRKSENDGSFLCSSRIMTIYGESGSTIKSGDKIALSFQQTTTYLTHANDALCNSYTADYLRNADFEEPTGRSAQFQFNVYAVGRKKGENILVRDEIVLKAVEGTGVVSVKDVNHGNEDLVIKTIGDNWHYKDTFRIFKSESTADPGKHDPDNISAGSIPFPLATQLLLIGVSFMYYYFMKYVVYM